MIDWIQGQRFIEIADSTYSPERKHIDDYDNLPNTFNPYNTYRLKDVNLVYTHTFYVKELLAVIKNIKREFVIITHNSDLNVTSEYNIPLNVRKWFTTNVATSDGRLESIPIGLENDRWYPDLNKKKKMLIKLQGQRGYKNLVYMNHNIRTNLAERTKPYEQLLHKHYVTTRMGSNGQDFDDYLDNLYSHFFVVCPQGNGMDTHRLWETLYMGAIPIVKADLNNKFYEHFPILYVNDWDEINAGMLWEAHNLLWGIRWREDKLQFSYWKNKIYEFTR